MNKYIGKKRKNQHEEAVRIYFEKNGFKSLARGWPDFCFFKFKPQNGVEVVFVEVKRPDQNGIKPHQHTIKKIFERLGFNVKIAFGVNEDGSPNFKELKGRKVIGFSIWICPNCKSREKIYFPKEELGVKSKVRCMKCGSWVDWKKEFLYEVTKK